MKSPFQRSKPTHHGQRTAFDMSSKALYTATFGQLLPTFVREVQPGDHVEVSTNTFSRVMPMQADAYVRIKEHREFFFVPYRYLWSYWPTFITSVKDYNSNLLRNAADNKIPIEVPGISTSDLRALLTGSRSDAMPGLADQYDIFGMHCACNAQRLLNLLGYGKITFDWDGTEGSGTVAGIDTGLPTQGNYNFNPFRLLAYHKIYMDYYRPTDYQVNEPDICNMDDVSGVTTGQTIPLQHTMYGRNHRGVRMLGIHYRPYKKDFFTGLRPSTYWFGNLPNSSDNANDSLVGLPQDLASDGQLSNASIPRIDSSALAVLQRVYAQNGSYSYLSTQQIRTMFALDKYLRTTLKAGKHYDDQILAHYGVRPNPDTSNEVTFLGGITTPMAIGEVVSTAASGSAPLGSIAGKGKAFEDGSKTISFDAQEHGIIMGIYSTSIDNDYDAVGVDPFNVKQKRASYYTPELDAIGPHVMRAGYASAWQADQDGDLPAFNKVVGLTDPWIEYKSVPDKVYGDFTAGGTKSYYTASRVAGHEIEGSVHPHDDEYGLIQLSALLTDPRLLDRIFGVNVNGSWITDQFLVNDYYTCKMVRNMSLQGEPRINS